MSEVLYNPKIKPEHLARKAIVYLRQSGEKQVRQNKESQLLQYAVADRVRARALPPLSAKASSVSSAWWHWERSESSAAGRYRGYPARTKTGVGCWRFVRSLERLSLTSNRSTI